MRKFDEQASAVKKSGYEIFWLGHTARGVVKDLELLLDMQLPSSFLKFLEEYGGGGVVGAEISGIEGGDAANDGGGTVWGDTTTCRSLFGLPQKFAVIYFHDDEICWCIDCRFPESGKWPVVSYDVFGKKADRTLSDDFAEFFQSHLKLYSKRT